jgi:hypothetical protein
MADNDTLLAYLVPAINPQVEPAATRALGYILNKSERAMDAFNSLVRNTTDETLAPVRRVDAEVAYTTEGEERGRLDLLGYDGNGETRVIVEAKFGANLLEGQGSGYLNQLSQNGKSVLMFLVPDYRIDYLWNEVKRDISKGTDEFDFLDEKILGRIRATKISKSESYLMMVSWRDLLKRMEENTGGQTVKADIHQLQGLTERMDMDAFSPIKESELCVGFARRMLSYNRLIDAVVGQGTRDEWMSIQGLRATPQSFGYGRYFHFRNVDRDFWFGVNFEQWSKNGGTPLWVTVNGPVTVNTAEIVNQLNVQMQGRWIPIDLNTNVDYDDVLNDLVAKLKIIGRIAGSDIP